MRKVLTACLLLMSAAVWAQNEKQQNEFDMTAQIRPRAEYRNGALSPRSEEKYLLILSITGTGFPWNTVGTIFR